MPSNEQIRTMLDALADDSRMRLAFYVFAEGKRLTLTDLRLKLGWPNDINHVKKVRYHVERLTDAGILLRTEGAPGKAHEYEINPDVAADVLAFIEQVME